MKYNRIINTLIIILVFIILPTVLKAQGPGFGDDTTDTSTPIDGGVSALVIAGVGYGVKKIRDAKKKKTDTPDTEA